MFLDSQRVPSQVFRDVQSTLPILSDSVEATEILRRLSLVRKDPDPYPFLMHPMVDAAIYKVMEDAEREEAFENAVIILLRVFPGPDQGDNDMVRKWNTCQIYFPHLLRAWERGAEHDLLKSYDCALMLRNGAQ